MTKTATSWSSWSGRRGAAREERGRCGIPPERLVVARSAHVEPLLSGPLKGVQEVVFCSRSPYDDGHWYANIGYYAHDPNRKAWREAGLPVAPSPDSAA